jgi:cobalt-zinc-cadmium efflux system membrane fusion protein
MKNKIFVGMTVAVAVSLTSCSQKIHGNAQSTSVVASNVTLTTAQRQHIQLYTVQPSKFHKTVEAYGTVDFDQDQATSVLAPFGGPVTKLDVLLGAQVKASDPLAEVDSPDFATAISAYRKALATARTARQLADLDKDLLRHNGVSQREANQAESDATSAEADRDAARQTLVSMKVDPGTIEAIQEGRQVTNTAGIIRTPISGTVVERLITPGQLLQAGTTPSFTVADLSRVWVMAHLFGSDVASISVGDPAEVETGTAANAIPGLVGNISTELDPDTRSVAVRVVANNPENLLKKQMYVRVRIQSRQETTGLLVPVSAILRDDENLPFVYVAQPDGSFARRPVTLGYRTGDDYDISSGLNAGDQIVTEGGIFVQFLESQ